MHKPIHIRLPSYYNEQINNSGMLMLKKTMSLFEGDQTKALYLAKIVSVKDYVCSLSEVSEKCRKNTSRMFKQDLKEKNFLPLEGFKEKKIEVYSYNFTTDISFESIYLLVFDENWMLEIASIVEPNNLFFFKNRFAIHIYDIVINKELHSDSCIDPHKIFDITYIDVDHTDLLSELKKKNKIKAKKEKIKLLLNPSHYNFKKSIYDYLLSEEYLNIHLSFCQEWHCLYELYNIENFSDPNKSIDSLADYWKYQSSAKKPHHSVCVYTNITDIELTNYFNLYEKTLLLENKLLLAFEAYTFGGGLDPNLIKNFECAKKTIEQSEAQLYTNTDFLKKCLSLNHVEIKEKSCLQFHYTCAWDTEHGVFVTLTENGVFTITNN